MKESGVDGFYLAQQTAESCWQHSSTMVLLCDYIRENVWKNRDSMSFRKNIFMKHSIKTNYNENIQYLLSSFRISSCNRLSQKTKKI